MVTITSAGLPSNGVIYYTTDQTMPTHESTFVASGGAVTVVQSETITAVAYAMGTCSDSAVVTTTYAVPTGCADPCLVGAPCAAPTFMPGAGELPQGSTVTLVPPANFPATFPQGNGTIYYTVDGTIPTHESPAYSGPIQINAPQTIHALASYPGVCTDSSIALASFTVIATPTMQRPAPSPTLAYTAGGYSPTLASSTFEASMRYTTDGSAPTCATGTPLAGNPGAVPTFTTSMTFNAIACKVGYAPSAVAEFVYGLDLPFLDGAAPADGGAADAPPE